MKMKIKNEERGADKMIDLRQQIIRIRRNKQKNKTEKSTLLNS
jgi:hypothetical protein